MKVLSLAWKYHPSITSGVGVACEGINKALSNLVDLKVIYPKVNKVQLREEVLLGSEDLSIEQKKIIEEEYIHIQKNGSFELAVSLDPYHTTSQSNNEDSSIYYPGTRTVEIMEKRIESIQKKTVKTYEKLFYDEVDVFGEHVQDKIYVYNRLVEMLAENLDFDIIHAHDWMTFMAGIALKNRYQKPLVIHVHSLEYDRVGHKDASWVYHIERYAMSKADKVISASDYTKGLIESNYGLSSNQITTVYNAVSMPEKIEDFGIKKVANTKYYLPGE